MSKMNKLFKGLVPVLLIVSMLFTLGAEGANQDNYIKQNSIEQEDELELQNILKEDEVDEELKEEPEEEIKEEPKEENKEEEKGEAKEDSKDKLKEESKDKPKEELKKNPKEEAKEEPEESKEEAKSEEMIEEDELAENIPPVEGEPDIVLPAIYRQGIRLMSTGLEDTIDVDKTAVRTTDEDGNICGCRTYEVTLDITGSPQEAPVDVVLVLDRSGSMNERVGGWGSNTRLYYAKEAAVNFAGRVLGANGIPGSRVSIVTFNGPQYTSGYGDQSQATTNLNLTSNLNTVVNTINAITATGGTNTEAGFIQGQSVIQGSISNQNPNSSKVVIMFTDGLPTASNGNRYQNTTNINHIHIQRAIAAGKNIYQNNIADVFTIGLTTGMSTIEKNLADNILTQAQNKGYYPAPSSTDLDQIFNDISTQLGYSATNAVVVDKIGDKFDLVDPNNLPAGATYDANTREITWQAGTIETHSQLKYIVRAKLDTPAGMADTNEYANLNYIDIFGNAAGPKEFPVPEVDVKALMQIELTDATITKGDSISLGTGIDPNGENYMGPVTGGDGGTDFTYQWRIVGDSTIISEDKNPTVNPTEDTEYEITVTSSTGCVAVAVMKVTVEDIKTSFGIKKIAQGSENLLDGAKFSLKEDGIEVKSEVTEDGYAWMNDLLPGIYALEEIEAPEGYKSNNQVYEIVIAEDGTITVDPELELETKDNKQVLVIENELLEFSLSLKKIDKKSKELLDGAEFELRLKEDGVIVATETTEDGYIDLDNLLAGTYTLKETVAPVGYRLDDTEYTITISATGEISVDPDLAIEDEDGKKVIVLENIEKVPLPNTGGPGSLIFILLGIALMAIPYMGFRKKQGRI